MIFLCPLFSIIVDVLGLRLTISVESMVGAKGKIGVLVNNLNYKSTWKK